MKLSITELNTVIASYLNEQYISGAWQTTVTSLSGMIDKIGKQVSLDGTFADQLPEIDGDDLPLGKTVEEFYADLQLAQAYDPTGANTLAPSYPTYREPSYSYSLGRRMVKTTYKYNDYERACINDATFTDLAMYVTKRLMDSRAMFRFNAKKGLIGVACKKAKDQIANAATFATNTKYEVNKTLQSTSSSGIYGVVVKEIPQSNTLNWAQLTANGSIILLDIVKAIAQPTNTTTGEAFVKQLKIDVEAARFPSEGHSLNGNTVGATEGLVLYVKKGIMPIIDVDVLAGAFHQDKVASPVQIRVVDDFGTDGTDCFAILVDNRGLKLHKDYDATREQLNADGDFINYVNHFEYTAFVSKNTYMRVYKNA